MFSAYVGKKTEKFSIFHCYVNETPKLPTLSDTSLPKLYQACHAFRRLLKAGTLDGANHTVRSFIVYMNWSLLLRKRLIVEKKTSSVHTALFWIKAAHCDFHTKWAALACPSFVSFQVIVLKLSPQNVFNFVNTKFHFSEPLLKSETLSKILRNNSC